MMMIIKPVMIMMILFLSIAYLFHQIKENAFIVPYSTTILDIFTSKSQPALMISPMIIIPVPVVKPSLPLLSCMSKTILQHNNSIWIIASFICKILLLPTSRSNLKSTQCLYYRLVNMVHCLFSAKLPIIRFCSRVRTVCLRRERYRYYLTVSVSPQSQKVQCSRTLVEVEICSIFGTV